MAGGEEKSRYELLEISDPSTLLVRGKLDKMIEIQVCFINFMITVVELFIL